MSNLTNVLKTAKTAAMDAEKQFIDAHGEPMYCGFAWVEVAVERTNSKVAKELAMAGGFDKSYKRKTMTLWNPGESGTQSMDVKEAGARAYAKVLQEFGLSATACSRAD